MRSGVKILTSYRIILNTSGALAVKYTIFALVETNSICVQMDSDNLQMLNVGYASLDGDWNWCGVGSPFTRIYYVVEGSAWIIMNGHNILLRPGHLYLIPAFTRHSYRCEGRFAHYYLHVYENRRGQDSLFDRYDFPTEAAAESGDAELFRTMCNRHPGSALPAFNPALYDNNGRLADFAATFAALPPAKKMFLRGVILILLSRFMAGATPKIAVADARLLPVMRQIDEHLDTNLDLDTLASTACMSKAYMIRLFRRCTGMTPLAYINRRRVEKAQLMLVTTGLSVKEIAYILGFTDNSYFNRLFKKTTGRTPLDYRNSTDG